MTENRISTLLKLLIATLAAYLSSGIILQLIQVNIPVPEKSATRTDVAPVQQQSKNLKLNDYAPIWLNNIFQIKGRSTGAQPEKKAVKKTPDKKVETKNAKVAAAKTTPTEELPKSELRYYLIGTVVGRPKDSYAVINIPEERQHKLFHLGDQVGAATIVKIERNRIVIDNNGRLEVLEVDFEKKVKGRRNPKRSLKRGTTRQSKAAKGVKKISANKFILDREEVENLSGDVTQFMTQVRIVPNRVDGKPSGYKLFNIKKGSIIESVGLRNGDVIKSINGMSINKPEEAFMAYQQVKDGGAFNIELQRRGRTQTLQYEVR